MPKNILVFKGGGLVKYVLVATRGWQTCYVCAATYWYVYFDESVGGWGEQKYLKFKGRHR